MKRVLDIVVAALLLVLTSPMLLMILVGSAISLRAWPLFTQTRIGKDGEPFRFLKVRTLPSLVPNYTDKYSLADFRVPRFCRMLRHLHLDELPQLLLVLTGRMSLVGPRPEMPTFHESMQPAFARLRTSVRPGCTGLWQVSVGRVGLIAEHPEYDEYYVSHRSFRLDLWILLRTVLHMLPFVRNPRIEFDDLPSWAPTPPHLALNEA